MLSFYLYSVTSISLTVCYIGTIVLVNGLLKLLLGLDLGLSTRQAISLGAGFAIVALPAWWLHWRWLRVQFLQARGMVVTWHRFYLFTVICLNAMVILIGGGLGLTKLVGLAVGTSEPIVDGLASAGTAIVALVLSLGLWLHHWRQLRVGLGERLP